MFEFRSRWDLDTTWGPTFAGGSLSDRTAFKVYALQRLHAATFRGVAAMTSSRPIWRTGPGVFPGQAAPPMCPARKGRRPTFHLTGASCPVSLLAQPK